MCTARKCWNFAASAPDVAARWMRSTARARSPSWFAAISAMKYVGCESPMTRSSTRISGMHHPHHFAELVRGQPLIVDVARVLEALRHRPPGLEMTVVGLALLPPRERGTDHEMVVELDHVRRIVFRD